jgi:hypothetical protein
MIDLLRKICKPVLKLDFRANGIMASLSEFRLSLLGCDDWHPLRIWTQFVGMMIGTLSEFGLNLLG